jgi:hypothetical protein
MSDADIEVPRDVSHCNRLGWVRWREFLPSECRRRLEQRRLAKETKPPLSGAAGCACVAGAEPAFANRRLASMTTSAGSGPRLAEIHRRSGRGAALVRAPTSRLSARGQPCRLLRAGARAPHQSRQHYPPGARKRAKVENFRVDAPRRQDRRSRLERTHRVGMAGSRALRRAGFRRGVHSSAVRSVCPMAIRSSPKDRTAASSR